MNGHCAVAQHGFGACGRHNQVTGTIGERITHVPEMTRFFFRQHFQIRDGGVQHRVPVYQTLTAIDEPILIESDKHFFNGVGQAFIHSEAFT